MVSLNTVKEKHRQQEDLPCREEGSPRQKLRECVEDFYQKEARCRFPWAGKDELGHLKQCNWTSEPQKFSAFLDGLPRSKQAIYERTGCFHQCVFLVKPQNMNLYSKNVDFIDLLSGLPPQDCHGELIQAPQQGPEPHCQPQPGGGNIGGEGGPGHGRAGAGGQRRGVSRPPAGIQLLVPVQGVHQKGWDEFCPEYYCESVNNVDSCQVPEANMISG